MDHLKYLLVREQRRVPVNEKQATVRGKIRGSPSARSSYFPPTGHVPQSQRKSFSDKKQKSMQRTIKKKENRASARDGTTPEKEGTLRQEVKGSSSDRFLVVHRNEKTVKAPERTSRRVTKPRNNTCTEEYTEFEKVTVKVRPVVEDLPRRGRKSQGQRASVGSGECAATAAQPTIEDGADIRVLVEKTQTEDQEPLRDELPLEVTQAASETENLLVGSGEKVKVEQMS
ncbi:hypothetical protein Q1695_011491 [Nippostrongylus brasiliensis]|nr:hypothetical protein Q1695_011491 [Nippostrongylus brasiliensis]